MKKKIIVIVLAALIIMSLAAYYFISTRTGNDGLQGLALQNALQNNSALHYGDIIELKSYFGNLLYAKDLGEFKTINLTQVPGEGESDWKIIKAGQQGSTSEVRFNDKVLLYSPKIRLYLAGLNNKNNSNVRMTYWGEEDGRWIIVNPAKTGSTEIIKPTDTVAFKYKNFSNYLSAGRLDDYFRVNMLTMKSAGRDWTLTSTSYLKNWMALTPEIHNQLLKKIAFPATHDSGTYSFLNEIAPENETEKLRQGLSKINDIANGTSTIKVKGVDINLGSDFSRKLKNEAEAIFYDATKDLARCTDYNIAQQLNHGIRWLDLRIYLRDGGAYTHHALTGVDMNSVLDSIQNFLSTTKGEILVVEMSHLIGNEGNYDAFAQNVKTKLGNYAYTKEFNSGANPTNNPFEKTYNQITGNRSSSKVILIMDEEPEDKNAASDPVFWKYNQLNIDTEKYSYSNTTDKEFMISNQLKQFKAANTSNGPYTLWYTLTGNTEDSTNVVLTRICDELPGRMAPYVLGSVPDVLKRNIFYDLEEEVEKSLRSIIKSQISTYPCKYKSIKELSQRINPNLQTVLETKFQNVSNRITVIYADYFENTKLVETAIKFSCMNPIVEYQDENGVIEIIHEPPRER